MQVQRKSILATTNQFTWFVKNKKWRHLWWALNAGAFQIMWSMISNKIWLSDIGMIFYLTQDVNELWETLHNVIRQIADRHCPLKVYKNRKQQTPWLTEELLELMFERDRTYRKAKKTKLNGDWICEITANHSWKEPTKILVCNWICMVTIDQKGGCC